MQQSIWLSKSAVSPLQQLTANEQADVCIVGGGLVGIYSAYLLAKRGLRVIVLEANKSLACGATGLSTGKLTAQHGLFYSKLPETLREPYFRAQQQAIERALSTCPTELHTQSDAYLYATTTQSLASLKQEFAAYEKMTSRAFLTKEIELPQQIQLALCLPGESNIDPVTFAQYFAQQAEQYGAKFYGQARVTHIEQKQVITSDNFSVQCRHILIATHYPIASTQKGLLFKLSISRSYLTATPIVDTLNGQYLSVDTDSRTVRSATIDGEHYLLYGGGSHNAGTVTDTGQYYDMLSQELEQQFHLQKPISLWSNQDIETIDRIPYIGAITDHLSIATGFHKWGLSNSLVAGEIICAQLCSEFHEATDLFSPRRKLSANGWLTALMQTGFIGEQFITGHVKRRSAPKCRHLGCKTNWNEADRTWDCPCHGSRYNEDGTIIEGPTVYRLK